MTWQAIVFGLVLVFLLVVTVPPLGRYMADVYGYREDGTAPGDRFFNPIERFIYRVCGIDDKREQRWNVYTLSLVAFSLVSLLVAVRAAAPAGKPAVQSRPIVVRSRRGARGTSQ